eukprot:CAMPEP_0171122162 /NCGR_PEP_ID=MMETSP0766_2-20121228/104400_1 /TAXON_ID=439317 /ORGANISM="Gambierdiscus australes, Strain CAWD 149" /LENGTH=98 /DNA_ID=CAMNT_0011584987 /DNA_START=45 /DNA_END=338 /DNA_ORIENTATION=+
MSGRGSGAASWESFTIASLGGGNGAVSCVGSGRASLAGVSKLAQNSSSSLAAPLANVFCNSASGSGIRAPPPQRAAPAGSLTELSCKRWDTSRAFWKT